MGINPLVEQTKGPKTSFLTDSFWPSCGQHSLHPAVAAEDPKPDAPGDSYSEPAQVVGTACGDTSGLPARMFGGKLPPVRIRFNVENGRSLGDPII